MNWLQTEAVKDNTLITVVAELVDDAMINRLLAIVSFKVMEEQLSEELSAKPCIGNQLALCKIKPFCYG